MRGRFGERLNNPHLEARGDRSTHLAQEILDGAVGEQVPPTRLIELVGHVCPKADRQQVLPKGIKDDAVRVERRGKSVLVQRADVVALRKRVEEQLQFISHSLVRVSMCT